MFPLTLRTAGAGKTKLVSRVIDYIKELSDYQRSDEGFAYFYFDRNDPDRCGASSAVCSLVRQLSVTADGNALQPELVELYRDKQRSNCASNGLHDDEAVRLLHSFVDRCPQMTLVFDALDESDKSTRKWLMDLLESVMQQRQNTRVKVFISSRLFDDIQRRLESGPNVSIAATDNLSDIAKFVFTQMKNQPQWRQKLSAEIQHEILDTLREKSEGM